MKYLYLKKVFDLHRNLRANKYYGKLFKTDVYNLKADLSDCKTVLDIGCGPNSIIKYCNNLSYSIGVEAFAPYVSLSKAKGIHTEYLNSNILDVNFKDNSFDAVIMVDVVEHLDKKDAIRLINRAYAWAKKKIIVITPLTGFRSSWNMTVTKTRSINVGSILHNLKIWVLKCLGLEELSCLILEEIRRLKFI